MKRIRTIVVLFVEDDCGEQRNQLIDQIQSEFSPGQFVKFGISFQVRLNWRKSKRPTLKIVLPKL